MTAISFEGLNLPFSVSDLVSSGNALLGFVSVFVLLGLAFTFVPLLIKLIAGSFSGGGSGRVKRDEYGNRVHFQSPEAKAYFENFKKEKGWR